MWSLLSSPVGLSNTSGGGLADKHMAGVLLYAGGRVLQIQNHTEMLEIIICYKWVATLVINPKYLWSLGWKPQNVTFLRLKKYSCDGTPPPPSWHIKGSWGLDNILLRNRYPGFWFVNHLYSFIPNLQDTGSLLIEFRLAGHFYHRLKHFIIWRRGATNTDIDSLLGEIVNFRNFYLSEIDCIHSRENLFWILAKFRNILTRNL